MPTPRFPLFNLSVVLCFFTFAAPAFADLASVTYSVYFDQLQCCAYDTVPQFNPIYGQLQDVTIAAELKETGTVFSNAPNGYTNFDITPVIVVSVTSAQYTGCLDFFPPASIDCLVLYPPSTPFQQLQGTVALPFQYDGLATPGGNQLGYPYLGTPLYPSQAAAEGAINSIVPYIGTGSLTYEAQLANNLILSTFRAAAGASFTSEVVTLDVTYDFASSGVPYPITPEPSYFAGTAALLGLIAWRGRRRRKNFAK